MVHHLETNISGIKLKEKGENKTSSQLNKVDANQMQPHIEIQKKIKQKNNFDYEAARTYSHIFLRRIT